MKTIEQISVFLENKPGTLLEAVNILSGAGVDLRALCMADTTDFGILRVIVSDPDRAMETFRANSLPCSRTQVLCVLMNDKPGALKEILAVLSAVRVNVEYAYAFLTPKTGCAYCTLKVDHPDTAQQALAAAGIPMLDSEALNSL